jgi:5S rRNA maturation endonuclease (ribonuclease M5)
MTTDEIKTILSNLNYPYQDCGDYLTSPALFRGGDNSGSLGWYPSKNLVIDFVTSKRYWIKNLLKEIIKCDSIEAVDNWISNKNIEIKPTEKIEPKIQQIEKFDLKEFESLIIPDYSYYVNRGISENVLKRFKCGVILAKSRLKNRFCFPIFNRKMDIVGISARAINDNAKIRWRQLGKKSSWCYPLFLNIKQIRAEKSVILVEGISDLLSFFQAGIENVVCLFGTECNVNLLNVFLRLNDIKIIISTNSDEPGKAASSKIESRLLKYFDRINVSVNLPPDEFKDFNEMFIKNGENSLIEWKNNLKM